LNIEQSIEIVIQVCKALEHAHYNNTIHRDVKPGNILLTQKDNRLVAKLTDFGIALDTAIEDKVDIIGTTPYMASEQLQPHQCPNVQWDIYALAVVLFEMIEGARPFDKTDTFKLIDSIQRGKSRPFKKHTPKALQTIILKGLEKNTNKRYQTANDMRLDLEIFQSLYSFQIRYEELELDLLKKYSKKSVYSFSNELFLSLTVDTLTELNQTTLLPVNVLKNALLAGAYGDYNEAEENVLKMQQLDCETQEHPLKLRHPFIKRFAPSEIKPPPKKDILFIELMKGVEQKILNGKIESAKKASKQLLELCNLPEIYLHLCILFYKHGIFDFIIDLWEQTEGDIFTLEYAKAECLASLYRYVGLAYYFQRSQMYNKSNYVKQAKEILQKAIDLNVQEQDVYDFMRDLTQVKENIT
jgi:hypothetical protein